MLNNIIRCPKTKNDIIVDTESNIVRVEDSDITYPIIDGIINLIPDVSDRISNAYDSSASTYDNYYTVTNMWWKLFSMFVWGFTDDDHQSEKVISFIPDGFDGILLDVPVGTGILTAEKYSKLKNAKIIAIDYSTGMLQKAKQLYTSKGLTNVTYIRADVSNLPLRDSSCGLCLTMAGLHVFPDKLKAINEIMRVTKPNSIVTGSFYIKGKRLISDIIVKYIFSNIGYFTPPFYTEERAVSILREFCDIKFTSNVKSGFYFAADRK